MKVADYERAILAALLLNPQVRVKVRGELSEDKFGYGPGYNRADSHRLIYDAIMELSFSKKPVDLLTVERQLGENLELVGGSVYLRNLTEVPDKLGVSAHNEDATLAWATFVDNAGRLRQSGMVIDKYAKLYEDFENLATTVEDVDQFLADLVSEVQEAQGLLKHSYIPVGQVVEDFRRRVNMAAEGKITEVQYFGWPSFYNAGLFPKDSLVVISGLESSGKTQLVLQILLGRAIQMAANNHKGCVAINSYEMPNHRLMKRMACCLAGVDGQQLMMGKYSVDSNEVKNVNEALDFIGGLGNIYFDDTKLLSSRAIKWESNALHVNYGPLTDIMVDYAELVPDTAESEELRVARVYRNVAGVRNLGTTAYVISQFSRWGKGSYKSKSKIGDLDDLRYTGAAGHAADVVAQVYNPPAMKARTIEFTCPDDMDEDKAWVILQKFKEGTAEMIPLDWEGHCTRFSDPSLEVSFGPHSLYENLDRVRSMVVGDF